METMYLIDTPGYFYACAYWTSAITVTSALSARWNTKITWCLRILFLVGLNFLMVVTDDVSKELFIPIMLLIVGIIFLIFYTTCDLDKITAGYYTVTSFVAGEFIASLCWQLYFYRTKHFVNEPETEQIILCILFCYSVAGVTLKIINKKIMKKESLRVGRKDLVTVIIYGVIVYFISNISYLYSNTPFSSQFSTEVFIIRTLTDFGGMTLLYAYHVRLIQMHYYMERMNLQNLVYMQYNNYRMAESSVELINQKYHDLKHQIDVFRQDVVSNQKVTKSLEKMEQEIKSYEAQNKTGNGVLDIILTSKSIYCQNHDIKLITIIDGAQLDFMDIMDISSLFGNILDNAIENTMKVKDREKRLIHLTITTQKGFLRIRAENYFDGELKMRNGVPITLKQDKKNHGFGLKSIKKTVEKYHGSTTIDVKIQWFELGILIPLS